MCNGRTHQERIPQEAKDHALAPQLQQAGWRADVQGARRGVTLRDYVIYEGNQVLLHRIRPVLNWGVLVHDPQQGAAQTARVLLKNLPRGDTRPQWVARTKGQQMVRRIGGNAARKM